MELKLLTPPKDSPFELRPTRSMPGEGALAISTAGLPRSLPLPAMDPQTASAPMEALARLGATGAQVGTQISGILLEAQARKRDADDLAEATGLYTQTATAFDAAFEKLKTSHDHNTLRPAFDETWTKLAGDAINQAPNPNVAQHLALKLAGLKVTKSAEVSDVSRRKFVDYHEATLIDSSKAFERMATDPEATKPDIDYAVGNLRSLYQGYARSGLFPPDRLAALQERYLTNIGNTLAHQALTKNPEAFLPKSDTNPEGQGAYRAFAGSGPYPADAKYLSTLVDTTGPQMLDTQRRERRLEAERTEKRFDEHMKAAHGQKFDELVADLDSGDPQKVRAASAVVDTAIRESGLYWTDGQKSALRTMARGVRTQGGVTLDTTYNSLYTRILESPGSVTQDEILHKQTIGELASTGERSAATLMEKARQMQKSDDTSQRADYQVGKALLAPLGTMAGALSAAAAYAPNVKQKDVADHTYYYSKALEEFDFRARMPGWADKNLRELAADIRDQYLKLLYPGYTPPGGKGKTP